MTVILSEPVPGFTYEHWPPAPIFPAKVWGEETAKRLFKAQPKATRKQVSHHMTWWEIEFRDRYSDWPQEGMGRAIREFRRAYLATRADLIKAGKA